MWEVANHTPYAVDHSWDRDRNGADTWIVLVKGTFFILPDGSTKAADGDQQEPICSVPEYWGEPGKSSLRFDSDLLRVKPATDVLLLGHAHAERRKPAPQVDVTLKIGDLEKTLRVFGDRRWEKSALGLSLTAPEPFLKMPIVYERAFGGRDQKSNAPGKTGWEERNPVGVGFAVEAKHLVGRPVPNVEYPDELISSWQQRPRPAGFGPIPPHWQPRVQCAGTYDEKWEKTRKPLVPDDLDERFYLCSPEDQRPLGHLRGGEPIELRNLTPEGILRFSLPRVVLGFETIFFTGEMVRHRQTLHTVIIEPDVPRVIMVWQTTLQCHAKALKLDQTRVFEKVLNPRASDGPEPGRTSNPDGGYEEGDDFQ